ERLVLLAARVHAPGVDGPGQAVLGAALHRALERLHHLRLFVLLEPGAAEEARRLPRARRGARQLLDRGVVVARGVQQRADLRAQLRLDQRMPGADAEP